MLKKEREKEILNILKAENGFITVKELCKRLFASESSIRRDLSVLENEGLINRTHGGAEIKSNYSGAIDFNPRVHHNTEAKKIIAAKAARLIQDGNIIFLDQSSTAFYLACEIANRSSLTVVTNNIEILNIMLSSNIKTISSGGFLSSGNRSCLTGTDAQYIFNQIHADFAFFSTKSLSDDGVISDCVRDEVLVRKAMLDNATKKVFLCDSEKFGTQSAYKQCSLKDVDYLISETESAKRFIKQSDLLVV